MDHFCIIDQPPDDADYVVFASRDGDGELVEHMRWMIPGSQLDEAAA